MHQQQPLDSYPGSLLQPHFDEEATLVSAKPVVPLSVVHSRGRRRNLLMFGGAIALSVLVGAIGGTLIYSQRNKQNQPSALTEQKSAAALTPASGGVTPEEPLEPTAEAVTTTDSHSDQDQLTEIPEPQLETRTNRTNRAQLDKKSVELVTAKSSAHEQRQVKADRGAAQQQRIDTSREERRPRRVDEAQTQMERNDSSDLFRIREIFEGPRSQRRRGDRRAIPY